MRTRTLATAALAALLVLIAPMAAHADPSHTSTLAGSTVTVDLDAEAFNAGQQATVVLMRVGARYSAPVPADIVYLNELTLDGSGTASFAVILPGGDLDDYVLAVNVAGATGRYLVSLDPTGPTPVEPPTGGTPGGGGNAGAGGAVANTGMPLAIGGLTTLALGLLAVGAVLVVRRRRAARA